MVPHGRGVAVRIGQHGAIRRNDGVASGAERAELIEGRLHVDDLAVIGQVRTGTDGHGTGLFGEVVRQLIHVSTARFEPDNQGDQQQDDEKDGNEWKGQAPANR